MHRLNNPWIALLFSLSLWMTNGHANQAALNHSKDKLHALENKIQQLQQNLNKAQDKQALLTHEFADTEKKISGAVSQLRSIRQNMTGKQHQISELQEQVIHLNGQLQEQQKSLADHIRTRYQLGEYQPMIWLLNQEKPDQINRLLTFYQYFIQSRETLIADIQTTRTSLNTHSEQLNSEVRAQLHLQQQLTHHQQQLSAEKKYHEALMHAVTQDIASSRHTLSEYQRDKENLARLIKSLAVSSVSPVHYSNIKWNHKFAKPIAASHQTQRHNQGVVFLANEGTKVMAISPGKVVFSDWLRGYGLLLIIDHGHGFMTLYAHNQALFKQKGTTVQQGDIIASVGHSGGILQNGLYFEMRRGGKAVPPLQWLS